MSELKILLKSIKVYYTNFRNYEKLRIEWRKHNSHNGTNPSKDMSIVNFPIDRVEVGKGTYGELDVRCWNTDNEKLIIGNYVSIASGVKFILGGNHEYSYASSFPFKARANSQIIEATSKGPIVVEDDVWIATDSIILSGVTIGRGSIVAAGSVVTKSIAPYSVVGGNPAKHIKYRFSETIVEKLSTVDFNKFTDSFISKNLDLLYTEITEDNIDEILEKMQ